MSSLSKRLPFLWGLYLLSFLGLSSLYAHVALPQFERCLDSFDAKPTFNEKLVYEVTTMSFVVHS